MFLSRTHASRWAWSAKASAGTGARGRYPRPTSAAMAASTELGTSTWEQAIASARPRARSPPGSTSGTRTGDVPAPRETDAAPQNDDLANRGCACNSGARGPSQSAWMLVLPLLCVGVRSRTRARAPNVPRPTRWSRPLHPAVRGGETALGDGGRAGWVLLGRRHEALLDAGACAGCLCGTANVWNADRPNAGSRRRDV